MLADLVMGDGASNRPSRQLSTAETDAQSQEARRGTLKHEQDKVSEPADGVDYWLPGPFVLECVRAFSRACGGRARALAWECSCRSGRGPAACPHLLLRFCQELFFVRWSRVAHLADDHFPALQRMPTGATSTFGVFCAASGKTSTTT